jgi:ABC-type dipeptide/oligopeptide/nickel transport system ATPase subunit
MQLAQKQAKNTDASNPGFNTLSELAAWAAQLEPWQQSALSKLISQQVLSEEDYATIFQEFLWDKKLEPAPAARVTYLINAPTAAPDSGAPIKLKAIKNVVGVNALTPDQHLDIGPQLTVVYGPNGSGKSGYARVLKASCFTRSKQLDILGNINIPAKNRQAVSATFDLHNDSETAFKAGKPNKVLRDNFAVFDSSCIRAHTDDRKSFVVTPYLFDVFPRMVAVIGKVNDKLKALKDSKAVDTNLLRIPDGKSEVATLLNNLSAKTDRNRLKVLGTFAPEDEARITQLETEIAQLRKSDPTEIITKKSGAFNDLGQLESKLEKCCQGLSAEVATAIATTLTELCDLRQQAVAISAATFDQEPLQPVGTPAWKNLLASALAYNEEVYPGHTYPSETDDARCVLCQQPLLPDGRDRLHRFHAFIKSDIENKIKAAAEKLRTLAQPIRKIDLAFFESESALRRTADEIDATLSQNITALLSVLSERKEAVALAATDETSFVITEVRTPAFKQIKALKDKLTEEIKELKTKDAVQLIKQYTDEQTLLNERKILSSCLSIVFAALDNLAWLDQAAKIGQISTRSVTERQKSLMTKLVGNGFRESFRQNCEQLGFDVPLDFKIRGTDGETNRQLEFETAGGADAQPSQVLSEGEQTAVAIADFLTEIALDERSVGLIFDDPVSSMDHMRKESIAKRLVQEACSRQVIIFTHDILFSHYLANEAEKIGAGFSFFGRTVARNHDNAVGCIDQIIFPHSHYEEEAADRAGKFLEKAKASTGDTQKDFLEKGCGCLRTAYEEFIQKKLFANVVRRWRENITFNLKEVYIDETIVGQIDEHMAILSRYIDAHSHSAEYHETPLTTDFLAAEIQKYKTLVTEYNAAKKQWRKNKGETVFA